MRHLLLLVALFAIPCALHAQAAPRFEEHFLDRTMRIDFFQTGNAEEVVFSLDQVLEEGSWAGNPGWLLDHSGGGKYFAKVYDAVTNRLLYSRGFGTIFGEYSTTDEAMQGLRRSFHQSVRIPFPQRPVRFVIEGRDEHHAFAPIFTTTIDPANVNIIRERPSGDVKVTDLSVTGPSHHRVDIALVAEGYTAEEEEKFLRDAQRFTEVIFRHEPFGNRRADLNIRAVFSPSAESGVDQPRRGIFRNSAVDSAFNALDLERYLLIDDNKALRDIAGAAPYDIVGVLANEERYGGGGIYHDYCISTVDNARSEFVFMHEFGHAFGNLADEYFTSTVSYNEFYREGQEPHEPNITALLDPEDVKWKHLLTPGIPVPTPWGQDEIAALQEESQSLAEAMKDEIARLDTQGAAKEDVQAVRTVYRDRMRSVDRQAEDIRRRFQELYQGKIGVFEGAGYSAKGLYRSEIHVGMLHEGSYGPVSEEAISRKIDELTGTAPQR